MKIQVLQWIGSGTSLLSSALSMTCPLCIPGLAALVTSVGLGIALSADFMQGALIVLLLVSIGSFLWTAKLQRRFWIVLPGIAGAALVYGGRYLWFHSAMLWSGAGLLIATALINLALKRRACCRCRATAAAS